MECVSRWLRLHSGKSQEPRSLDCELTYRQTDTYDWTRNECSYWTRLTSLFNTHSSRVIVLDYWYSWSERDIFGGRERKGARSTSQKPQKKESAPSDVLCSSWEKQEWGAESVALEYRLKNESPIILHRQLLQLSPHGWLSGTLQTDTEKVQMISPTLWDTGHPFKQRRRVVFLTPLAPISAQCFTSLLVMFLLHPGRQGRSSSGKTVQVLSFIDSNRKVCVWRGGALQMLLSQSRLHLWRSCESRFCRGFVVLIFTAVSYQQKASATRNINGLFVASF